MTEIRVKTLGDSRIVESLSFIGKVQAFTKYSGGEVLDQFASKISKGAEIKDDEELAQVRVRCAM